MLLVQIAIDKENYENKIIFVLWWCCAVILCYSTVSRPIPLDKTNYVFDFNQNGRFEKNEYEAYLEYKKTKVVPDEAIDINHDGKQSYAELKRMLDCLQKNQTPMSDSVLEELKKIPGISIQKIEEDPKEKK